MRKTRSIGLVGTLMMAILIVGGCSPVQPGDGAEGVQASRNTIHVAGVGEAKGAPDIASIQLGVNLVDTNLEQVIENGNQAIATITSALVEAGVDANDIRTTNYGIWPEDIYDRSTGEATGERKYHSDVTLEVTIRSIDRMGEFIQTGLDAGVNNIYGIGFSLDERTALETAARAAAIADARARAEELAAGLGKNVGDTLSISEGIAGLQTFGIGAARPQGGGGGAPISPGQSTVTVEVSVVFELLQ